LLTSQLKATKFADWRAGWPSKWLTGQIDGYLNWLLASWLAIQMDDWPAVWLFKWLTGWLSIWLTRMLVGYSNVEQASWLAIQIADWPAITMTAYTPVADYPDSWLRR